MPAHILNGYDDIESNYSIFKMQDFINGLWSSMLDLFWSGGILTMVWQCLPTDGGDGV